MDLVLEMAAGKYMVDFGNDGTIEIEGVYELQETQMTIKDTGGERACLNQVGVYSFKVTTEDLIMTPISDPCEGRSGPDAMQFTRMD